jgi:GxxExxY protein
MSELILGDEVFAIVGAAMDVYYRLGRGYLEAVYHEALEIEMGRRGIPFESKRHLIIYYKDQPLKTHYYPDMVCYDQLIVELKVMDRLMPREAAQVIHYLKGTRMRVGYY